MYLGKAGDSTVPTTSHASSNNFVPSQVFFLLYVHGLVNIFFGLCTEAGYHFPTSEFLVTYGGPITTPELVRLGESCSD